MTTPESPVTPGNDAALREWAMRLFDAYLKDRRAKYGTFPAMEVEIRSLCEAVAAAERERAAMATFDRQIGDPRTVSDHAYNLALSDANRVIRSLRGLPEIGSPRE